MAKKEKIVVQKSAKPKTAKDVQRVERNAEAARRRLADRQAEDAARDAARKAELDLIAKKSTPEGRAELERQYVEAAISNPVCGRLIRQLSGIGAITYSGVKMFFRSKPNFSAHEPEDLLVPRRERKAA